MKKRISIILSCIMLISMISDLGVRGEETITNVETPPISGVYCEFDPEATQEPYEEEPPEVHEETVEGTFEIDVTDIDETLSNNGVSLLATTENDKWETLYAQQFGDEYLAPYKKRDGQQVTGNTNRLTIEETDLVLPGKNGLDVEIKRKHDNQDYLYSYSAEDLGRYVPTIQDRHCHAFINSEDNSVVNIAFHSNDEMYNYMYDGLYISDFLGCKTHKFGDVSYYNFEDIYDRKTDDTEAIHLTYKQYVCFLSDNTVSCRRQLVESKLSQNKSRIGEDWSLVLPESYLYCTYEDKGDTHVNHNYNGAFKDIDGSTFTFRGYAEYIVKSDNTISYYSSFTFDHDNAFRATAYYANQTLDDGTVYNFVIKDRRNGYTYYMYDTGIRAGTGKSPEKKHSIYVTEVRDRYDNAIRYEYGFDYNADNSSGSHCVSKIIDTYGREINITGDPSSFETSSLKQVSYTDDNGDTKTITYETEKLPASALQNDSKLRTKEVRRFKVTNTLGETTIYDSRDTSVITACCFLGIDEGVEEIMDPGMSHTVENFHTNIERIIYPTGAETHYKYKLITIPNNKTTYVRREVYAVDESYDLIGDKKYNHKTYSVETNFINSYGIWLNTTENNLSNNSSEVRKYDYKERLTNHSRKDETQNNSKNKSEYESYEYYNYDKYHNENIIKRKYVSRKGSSVGTEYEYVQGHNYLIKVEIQTDKREARYTYFTNNGILTSLPQKITYYDISNNKSTLDYSLSMTLTSDNKNIEYVRTIKDNMIIAQTKYEYDSEGNITARYVWTGDTNGDGQLDLNDEYTLTQSEYSDNPNKTQHVTQYVSNVHNADGEDVGTLSAEYDFDLYGNPVSKTDPNGNITTIEYDSLARPVKQTLPNGGETTIEYSLSDKTTTVTDAEGGKTIYTYDALGNLLTVKARQDGMWKLQEKYNYDSAQRAEEKYTYYEDSKYKKEKFTYDGLDRVLEKQAYDGASFKYAEQYTYNIDETIKQTVGIGGPVAATEKEVYDDFWRPIRNESTSGDITITHSRTYDYKDQITEETDPNGNKTVYTYDTSGNLLTTTNALNGVVSKSYDMAGRVITQTDANGNQTVYTYDEMDRVIKTQSPFGTDTAVTKQYYDGNSNVISVKTKNNAPQSTESYRTVNYVYDNMNNLRGTVENNGEKDKAVQYEYDLCGRMTKRVTGISGIEETIPDTASVTSYEYDELGYVNSITDPLGQSEYYVNNQNGTPNIYIDKNNNNIQYSYVMFGVKDIDYPLDAVYEEYTYDNLGRVKSKISNSEDGIEDEITYEYDAFGRVTKETTNGISNIYEYDLNSNVTHHKTEEDGSTIYDDTHTYDSLNRLTQTEANGITSSYEYDNNGNMTKKTAQSLTAEIEYNNANLPVSLYNKVLNKEKSSYSYEYSLDGNRIKETDDISGNSKTYTYDQTGQLIREELEGSGIKKASEYTYDIRGNRIQKYSCNLKDISESSEITAYGYDANNRMTQMTRTKGEVSDIYDYTYDNNGNMIYEIKNTVTDKTEETGGISVEETGGGYVKQYEYDKHNRLVKYQDDTAVSTYEYTMDGLRKSKTVNGETTEYIWDRGNMIYDGISQYMYGPDGIETAWADEFQYYVKDIRGSVTYTTDFMGNNINEYGYDSFGNKTEETKEYDDPFGYCGEYYDEETGNVYLRNRYYNPNTGRFITEDPAKDGLNWYVYCGNNPVMFVDPLGLEYLVVSGSEYDGFPIFNERYKYNFIEPAIKKIKELKDLNDGEWITWIISSSGYSDEDIKNFNDIAYDLGVGIQFINSSADLQNYINSKNTNTWNLTEDRLDDPIEKFVVFSHGVIGSVELGYKQDNEAQLSLNYNWIQGIFTEAFSNPNSAFYSCNTGTDRSNNWGDNFAQNWVDRVGGRTWASVGKTSYGGIIGYRTENEERLSSIYGFNPYGARNYPTTDGQWLNYYAR